MPRNGVQPLRPRSRHRPGLHCSRIIFDTKIGQGCPALNVGIIHIQVDSHIASLSRYATQAEKAATTDKKLAQVRRQDFMVNELFKHLDTSSRRELTKRPLFHDMILNKAFTGADACARISEIS